MAATITRSRRSSQLPQRLTTGKRSDITSDILPYTTSDKLPGTLPDTTLHKQPDTRDKRGASGVRLPRQTPTTKDGIPIFDRNKVSLDFPGSLFGPSVSLLIKTTKVVGSVIQNSAVRYQSFLRLFSPLFRGPFEIKGLDPATTTTTTTTTEAPAQNEVRRR